MTKQELVPCALDILQALDDAPSLSLTDLCQSRDRNQTLPILERLSIAGLVEQRDDERFALCRPLCELTSLDVLTAIWGKPSETPAFQWLYRTTALPSTGDGLEAQLWALGQINHSNEEGK